MLRRTPLRRTKPMRQRSMRARARTRRPSKYRRRERDFAFMAWVRTQPCIVRALPPDAARITRCYGPVEADHLGARGIGQKADDRTCAPLCAQHHRERTDHSGAFRELTQAEHRIWRANVLDVVAANARHAAAIGVLA